MSRKACFQLFYPFVVQENTVVVQPVEMAAYPTEENPAQTLGQVSSWFVCVFLFV